MINRSLNLLGIGKLSEISETDFAPFLCIFQLSLQERADLLPSFCIHVRAHLLPGMLITFHSLYTFIIMTLERLPYGNALVRTISPRYAMKPQQVGIGTTVQTVIQAAIWFCVLAHGIGAVGTAVETDAVFIGIMIIDGAPFTGLSCSITTGVRT